MRSRNLILTATVAFLLTLGMTTPALACHTNFQGGCTSYQESRIHQKRSYARAYALVGRYEGYQWGGGCWNDNDTDDSPGDPTTDSATRGEGGDCSGFTTKSWEINSSGTTAFLWRQKEMNFHGSYTASSYRSATTAWRVISKSAAATQSMDAMASSTHIAMYYDTTSTGADRFIEAKQESVGTQLLTETYRGNTAFSGASRNGWEAECYPQCV